MPELETYTGVVVNTDEVEQDLILGIGIDLKSVIKKAEMQLVRVALGQTKGNVSRAAKLLKVNRTTLHEKMTRYKI
jgi:DNA-binding NtrC family response regulator